MKKLKHTLINDMKAILNKGVDINETENFIMKREADGKRTTVKVREWDLMATPHDYDYVYSPGLYALLKEVKDCVKIPVWSLSQLALRAGLSTACFFQKNVRHGIVTYRTFRKIRDLLKPYKNILKNWSSFVNIRSVPRKEGRLSRAYHARPYAYHEEYNAGLRKIARRRAIRIEYTNTFVDQDKGLVMKAYPEKDVVIHNMSGHFEKERLAPMIEEAKLAADRSVTNRGIVYAVTGKCDE